MAYRPKDTQERILHRLKIARGHLDKVIKMVESHDYCIDVLNQSQAVQSAIKQTDALLLENHLKTCVVDHIQKGETNSTVEEIMKVFRKNG
jgi:DNA-binding FrmR family transcriptional regulator